MPMLCTPKLSKPGAMPPRRCATCRSISGDRAEIIANLRLIARQIAMVEAVALDDFAEPAPVFRA